MYKDRDSEIVGEIDRYIDINSKLQEEKENIEENHKCSYI